MSSADHLKEIMKDFPHLQLRLRHEYGSPYSKVVDPKTEEVLVKERSNAMLLALLRKPDVLERLKEYRSPKGFGLTDPAEVRRKSAMEKLTRKLNDLVAVVRETCKTEDVEVGFDVTTNAFCFVVDGTKVRG